MSRRRPSALVLAPALAAGLIACGDNVTPAVPDADQPGHHVYRFGPYPLAPGEEHDSRCVSVTLDNDLPMFVNEVSLTTGDGFHHSNWFWVPETAYAGEDDA